MLHLCLINFTFFWALSRVVTQIDYFVKNISSVQATAKISQTDDKQFHSNQFNIYTVNFLSNNTIVARVALHGVPYGPHDKLKCTIYGTKGHSTATYPSMKISFSTNTTKDKKRLMTKDNALFYFNNECNWHTPYGCIANYLNVFANSVMKVVIVLAKTLKRCCMYFVW